MNEQFKQVALRWLELRDSPGVRPSLDEFCATEFPNDTAQQKSLLIQLDRFDEALQHWIEPNKEEAPKIDGYNFLDQIAVGGMGVVWRAYEDRLCRVLAVKVMKHGLRDHPPSIASFQSEAQLTARLAHPNLVPIHELGVCQDGRYFYSMKLVEGQTLAEKLRRPDDIVTQRMALLKVFSQICQGVAFAHNQSIIHRDLKPENIMLGAQGEVQVMDWGACGGFKS